MVDTLLQTRHSFILESTLGHALGAWVPVLWLCDFGENSSPVWGLHFFMWKTNSCSYLSAEPGCVGWSGGVLGSWRWTREGLRALNPSLPNSQHGLCSCLSCGSWRGTDLPTALLPCHSSSSPSPNLDFPARHVHRDTFSLVLSSFICAPTTGAAWI